MNVMKSFLLLLGKAVRGGIRNIDLKHHQVESGIKMSLSWNKVWNEVWVESRVKMKTHTCLDEKTGNRNSEDWSTLEL